MARPLWFSVARGLSLAPVRGRGLCRGGWGGRGRKGGGVRAEVSTHFCGTLSALALQAPKEGKMIRSIRRRTQHLLVLTGLAVWLVVTTPVADYLARPLRLAPELKQAQAIVVL